MPDQELKQVHLFFSNRLDILSTQLAAVLKLDLAASAARGSHFTRPQIVIESAECAAYVKMRLAQEHGIWANFKISRSIKFLVSQAYRSKHESRLLTKNLMVSAILASSGTGPSKKTINAVELSKAIALAERLEDCFLNKPQSAENWRRPGEGVDELDKAFKRIQKELDEKPDLKFKLPHQIVEDTSFWDEFDADSRLYIFDPSPYSTVDLLWLQALSKRVEIVVFAFSPCARYWGDTKASVRRKPLSLDQATVVDGSQDKDCDFWTKDKWDGHFLLERCGRISSELARDFLEATEYNQDGKYAPEVADNLTTLQKIQSSALALDQGALPSKMYKTLGIHAFGDIETECEALAEAITNLEFEKEGLALEDVVVLLPHKAIEVYGAKLASALEHRGITCNMSDLGIGRADEIAEAFEAFVALLVDRPSRGKLLDFLLNPAICSPEYAEISDDIVECIHALGIFENRPAHSEHDYLKGERDFGWRQGIERLCLALTHSEETLDGITLPHVDPQNHILMMAWFGQVEKLMGEIEDLSKKAESEDESEKKLGLVAWRNAFVGLFVKWLKQDFYMREEGLNAVNACLTSRWPEDLDGVSYDYGSALTILKMASVGVRTEIHSDHLIGGVQVRRLSPVAFEARYVYMLGMDTQYFPSDQKMGADPDRFSSYEVDAHAFLKWFMQCGDSLYISASVLDASEQEAKEQEAKKLNVKEQEAKKLNANEQEAKKLNVKEQEAKKLEAKIRGRLVPFVADIATIFSDLNLSDCAVKSSAQIAEQTHLDAIKELRKAYQAEKGQWPSGPWDFDPETRPKVEKLFSEEDQGKVDGQKTDASTKAPFEFKMNWRALPDLLDEPYMAYRQYRLKISEYLPTTVAVKRGLDLEPIEKDRRDYEARYFVDKLVEKSIRAVDHLATFEKLYDRESQRLVQTGFYPADLFAEVQKVKDFILARTVLDAYEALGLGPVKFYNYDFQGKEAHPGLDALLGDNPSQMENIEIPYEHLSPKTNYKLKGKLPLIVENASGELSFLVFDCIRDDLKERDKLRISFAGLFLLASGKPVPEKLIHINRKGKVEEYDLDFSQWTAKKTADEIVDKTADDVANDAKAFLNKYLDFFDTGLHELSLEDSKKPLTLENLTNSPLHRFAVSEIAHKGSFDKWKEQLATFGPLFNIFAAPVAASLATTAAETAAESAKYTANAAKAAKALDVVNEAKLGVSGKLTLGAMTKVVTAINAANGASEKVVNAKESAEKAEKAVETAEKMLSAVEHSPKLGRKAVEDIKNARASADQAKISADQAKISAEEAEVGKAIDLAAETAVSALEKVAAEVNAKVKEIDEQAQKAVELSKAVQMGMSDFKPVNAVVDAMVSAAVSSQGASDAVEKIIRWGEEVENIVAAAKKAPDSFATVVVSAALIEKAVAGLVKLSSDALLSFKLATEAVKLASDEFPSVKTVAEAVLKALEKVAFAKDAHNAVKNAEESTKKAQEETKKDVNEAMKEVRKAVTEFINELTAAKKK